MVDEFIIEQAIERLSAPFIWFFAVAVEVCHFAVIGLW
jgi:hypothetical protein